MDAIAPENLFSEEEMRYHTIIFLPGLLLIMLLAGCAQPIRSTETPSPASTVTPTETMTPTLILTPTVIPTDTPTAIPTFTEEQARARLLELLANNGCRLPCLWGITPGKSTSQEAQAILGPLSTISVSTNFHPNGGGSIVPWYTEDDLVLTTTVGFNVDSLSNNQIVSRIGFHAGEHKHLPDDNSPIYDSKTFGERLRPYMLPGILSEFGKPASVVMQTYGKQVGIGGFEIILVYPDQGIFVHYIMQMRTVGSNARGCPANAEVQLELSPSGDANAFTKSLAKTDWGAFAKIEPVDNPYWKSIDIATSMTLEQFYETFRQPTDKCIETPLKGWYVPEQ
jgi:hypothetical protein